MNGETLVARTVMAMIGVAVVMTAIEEEGRVERRTEQQHGCVEQQYLVVTAMVVLWVLALLMAIPTYVLLRRQ